MNSASERSGVLSLITSKIPHFFKIILEDTIREGKLEIPKKFVKKYGSSLPNSVLLRVPSGKVWPVELSKFEDNVWIHNGWREFIEYYSLDYGHLLVFEHKRHSQFHVLIFDKSAVEINYPCDGTICNEQHEGDRNCKETETERTGDDVSIGILDDFAASHRRREMSSVKSLHLCPPKKMRNDSSGQMEWTSMSLPRFRENGILSHPSETSDHVSPEFGGMSADLGIQKARVSTEKWPFTSQKNVKALQRALAFESENPSFMMTMKPSYIKTGRGLLIPMDFSRKYPWEKQSAVTLCVSGVRTWSVGYHRNEKAVYPRAILNSSWHEFVQDNSLKVGDVCVFELIEISERKFEVFIFRVDEDPNIHLSPGYRSRPNEVEPKRKLEKNIASNCSCNSEVACLGCLSNSPAKKLKIKFDSTKSTMRCNSWPA